MVTLDTIQNSLKRLFTRYSKSSLLHMELKTLYQDGGHIVTLNSPGFA